jgi:Uma2 family endonuclease
LQTALAGYLVRRRKEWKIEAYAALRIKIREERYPSRPPLLWIEILSQDDKMIDVWNKANELIQNGVPYVWIIDPNTLESELRTASGSTTIADKALRLEDSPIVVPLPDVMDE